jgi:hypothetical protein
MHVGYCLESQKVRDHWEDQEVGGWRLLKWREMGWDSMDWIDVDQDRERWKDLVNTVMSLRVP